MRARSAAIISLRRSIRSANAPPIGESRKNASSIDCSSASDAESGSALVERDDVFFSAAIDRQWQNGDRVEIVNFVGGGQSHHTGSL